MFRFLSRLLRQMAPRPRQTEARKPGRQLPCVESLEDRALMNGGVYHEALLNLARLDSRTTTVASRLRSAAVLGKDITVVKVSPGGSGFMPNPDDGGSGPKLPPGYKGPNPWWGVNPRDLIDIKIDPQPDPWRADPRPDPWVVGGLPGIANPEFEAAGMVVARGAVGANPSPEDPFEPKGPGAPVIKTVAEILGPGFEGVEGPTTTIKAS